MKKINRPIVEDVSLLLTLARNHNLQSFPELRNHLRPILRAYIDYNGCSGNPLDPAAPHPLGLADELKKNLKGHYTNPPKALARS
jgi:hypothetical protein